MRMAWLGVQSAVLAALLACTGQTSSVGEPDPKSEASEEPARTVVKETHVASLSDGVIPESIVIDRRRARVAYLSRVSDRVSVVVNREVRETLSASEARLKVMSLSFDERGDCFAYTAPRKRGWQVMHCGGESVLYDWVSEPVFAESGALVYAGRMGGRCEVVVSGQIAHSHDCHREAVFTELEVDPTGKRVGYQISVMAGMRWDAERKAMVVQKGAGPNRTRLFIGGELILEVPMMRAKPVPGRGGGIVFSGDGKRVAYLYKEEGRGLLGVDRQSPRAHRGILTLPYFGGAGKRLAYGAIVDEKKATLFVDDEEVTQMYDSRGFQFSEDGKHYVVAINRNSKWHLLKDGEVGAAHDSIELPRNAFLPGSGDVYYRFRSGDRTCVVVGSGDPDCREDEVELSGITASPSGRHVAYVGQVEGGLSVLVNGVPGPAYRSILNLDRGPCVFFTDDDMFQYLAYQEGGKVIQVSESLGARAPDADGEQAGGAS